jgi:hypothetical protein
VEQRCDSGGVNSAGHGYGNQVVRHRQVSP